MSTEVTSSAVIRNGIVWLCAAVKVVQSCGLARYQDIATSNASRYRTLCVNSS
jgi:hypothetical protein